MGIEDEDQIFNILKKNKFAMDKLKGCVPQGTMVVSDLLSEWELPIGALQSKIIRRVTEHFKKEKESGTGTDKDKDKAKDKEVCSICILHSI